MIQHAEDVDLVCEALQVFLITALLLDDFHGPRLSSDLVNYLLDFSISTLAYRLQDFIIVRLFSTFFIQEGRDLNHVDTLFRLFSQVNECCSLIILQRAHHQLFILNNYRCSPFFTFLIAIIEL